MNISKKRQWMNFIGCIILLGIFASACQRENSSDKDTTIVTGDEITMQSGNGEGDQNGHEKSEDISESDEFGAKEDGTQQDLTWETYPWQMKPGEVTMENFLITAFSPVGQTMYIWGGGWNEEDTGAGPDATTLGLSPLWAEFAAEQTKNYDFHDYKYEIHKGLDCSGYVGWVIYNLFETENGQEGYVFKSTEVAENYAGRGWGTYTPAEQVSDWVLGDIVSMNGHVWICLGTCEDGSVVALHSSVSGVMVCGISLPDKEKSQAVLLAERFMSQYYPKWYERFPDCSRPYRYLTEGGRLRWKDHVLTDTWDLKDLTPEQLLESLGQKWLAK